MFQDACENYYADESSVAEMVLVGRAYWTETLPAWPLLRSLARGRPMEDRVHLVDHVDEAVDTPRLTPSRQKLLWKLGRVGGRCRNFCRLGVLRRQVLPIGGQAASRR